MIPLIFIVVAIVRIIIAVLENINNSDRAGSSFRKLRIAKAQGVIANNFIDSKHLFVKLNKQLPNVMLINGIDVNKALKLIETSMDSSIKAVYRHKQFDFAEQQIVFNMLIIVAREERIIEVGNSYVELLYTAEQAMWADHLAKELAVFQVNTTERSIARAVCVRGFAGAMN